MLLFLLNRGGQLSSILWQYWYFIHFFYSYHSSTYLYAYEIKRYKPVKNTNRLIFFASVFFQILREMLICKYFFWIFLDIRLYKQVIWLQFLTFLPAHCLSCRSIKQYPGVNRLVTILNLNFNWRMSEKKLDSKILGEMYTLFQLIFDKKLNF